MSSEKQRGIVPRKVKGFRDIDPNLNQLKRKIIESASKVYQSYGFEHWDTPVLEYADCLGKYMPDEDTVDKGVYSFNNPEEDPVFAGDGSELRDANNNVIMENAYLSLRYDLTAPLARLYSEQLWKNFLNNQVVEGKTPILRRYQYGPVYRYEIKLAPGRFREFWQLDFDSVGTNDIASDAEVAMILSDALEAIGLKRDTYRVKINNRKLLKGFLSSLGVETEDQEQAILRVVDKMDKIGLQGVEQELGAGRQDKKSGAYVNGLNVDSNLQTGIVGFLDRFSQGIGSRKEVLSQLNIDNPLAQEGLKELQQMDSILETLGFDESRVIFEPTLIRGMAYYTGPVFEVESLQTFKDHKGATRKVGSICGGGRYDGLVKQLLGMSVPATGASIGVDRLAELLIQTKQVPAQAEGPIFIGYLDDDLMIDYQKIAGELRNKGANVEIYYGPRKGFRGLKKQLSYADKKNCPVAILLGGDEAAKGVVTVRNLKLGKELASTITDKKEWKERVQSEVNKDDLIGYVLGILND